jgi:Helix-turn-helix.
LIHHFIKKGMTKKEITSAKEKFGKHLQDLRKSKKLSLLKLSYNCSIDESNISKIEHGQFNITLATIIELAKGLEIPPKKLLDFELE